MKKITLFLLLLFYSCCYSQKEGNIWYFGVNAGLDFNSGNPIPLTNGQINTNEGCSTVCNSDGQLLFYSDGVTVWNKNHQIMDNGSGLFGHESTSQSISVIKKPGSDTVYYLFTLPAEYGYSLAGPGLNGFYYSEVDISLNAGLGAVTTKNHFMFGPATEKAAIFKHANGFDSWVVVHGSGNKYYAYQVSASGVSETPVISLIGVSITTGVYGQGCMKASPDGTRLAVATTSYPGRIELFDFNCTNGVVSNLHNILTDYNSRFYGIEFSPDGDLLYVTDSTYFDVLQFNLNATNIGASKYTLQGPSGNFVGALQIGPDGKIYVSNYESPNLGVINNPNVIGAAANYEPEIIDLAGKSANLGLPTNYIVNPVTLDYTEQDSCLGNLLTFSMNTSITTNAIEWNFGDGNYSSSISPTHLYSVPGNYTVTLTITAPMGQVTKTKAFTVTTIATLPPTVASPQVFCAGQNATLNQVTIAGQDIKWYESPNNGNMLAGTTLLQDGVNYYATQTLNGCESVRVPFIASLLSQIPAPTASPQVFCESFGATVSNLQANGQNIQWYADALTTIPLNISEILTDNIYYTSQTINGCESLRTAVPVIVYPLPPPPIKVVQDIFCANDHPTLNDLTGMVGNNIKFYDTGGNLLTPNTMLQEQVNYSATQTINNCESMANGLVFTIQLITTPPPTGMQDQVFCAEANPLVSDLSVNGSGLQFYDSLTNGNNISNLNPLSDGDYYASQTINGCESAGRLKITAQIVSGFSTSDAKDTICDDLNDGMQKIDLSDYNSQIISNPAGYTFTYYKTLSDAQNQNITEQIVDFDTYILQPGQNNLFVSVSNNVCHDIANLGLFLLPAAIIAIPEKFSICKNESIILSADEGFNSYLWSTGQTTQAILVAQGGNYTVTVTKNYGGISCAATKNITVTESDVAVITNIETGDWTNNENTITVFATGQGNYQYSVDGINYQDNNQFLGLMNGVYNVFVKDKNGCGTVTDEVYLLMYPVFFTPNGDGFNDNWKIEFSNFEPGLDVFIFDRYGKFIKQLSPNGPGWDGTYNGYEEPATDYWFVVTRANGREYRGHFTLKR